jgi:hypothetical protein
MGGSRLPGPLRHNPVGARASSPLAPSRTPGPVGHNDAGDPNTAAHHGDTPGPVGQPTLTSRVRGASMRAIPIGDRLVGLHCLSLIQLYAVLRQRRDASEAALTAVRGELTTRLNDGSSRSGACELTDLMLLHAVVETAPQSSEATLRERVAQRLASYRPPLPGPTAYPSLASFLDEERRIFEEAFWDWWRQRPARFRAWGPVSNITSDVVCIDYAEDLARYLNERSGSRWSEARAEWAPVPQGQERTWREAHAWVKIYSLPPLRTSTGGPFMEIDPWIQPPITDVPIGNPWTVR